MIYKCKEGERVFHKKILSFPFVGYFNKRIKLECKISDECWTDEIDRLFKTDNRLLKIQSLNKKSIEVLFDPEQDIINIFNIFIRYNGISEKKMYICSVKADEKFTIYLKKNNSGIFLSVYKQKRIFSRKVNKIKNFSFYCVLGPKYFGNYVTECDSTISITKL